MENENNFQNQIMFIINKNIIDTFCSDLEIVKKIIRNLRWFDDEKYDITIADDTNGLRHVVKGKRFPKRACNLTKETDAPIIFHKYLACVLLYLNRFNKIEYKVFSEYNYYNESKNLYSRSVADAVKFKNIIDGKFFKESVVWIYDKIPNSIDFIGIVLSDKYNPNYDIQNKKGDEFVSNYYGTDNSKFTKFAIPAWDIIDRIYHANISSTQIFFVIDKDNHTTETIQLECIHNIKLSRIQYGIMYLVTLINPENIE